VVTPEEIAEVPLFASLDADERERLSIAFVHQYLKEPAVKDDPTLTAAT
jgi:hypothetical protein